MYPFARGRFYSSDDDSGVSGNLLVGEGVGVIVGVLDGVVVFVGVLVDVGELVGEAVGEAVGVGVLVRELVIVAVGVSIVGNVNLVATFGPLGQSSAPGQLLLPGSQPSWLVIVTLAT